MNNPNELVGHSLGRYHIIEPLGQGGMASVFRAYDTNLDRDVAIKVIRPDVDQTMGNEFLKRFQHEARALAKLDHPYILKVLDYGEQDGLPYLVMPFVPGGTLKQKMGQPIPYPEAAALLAPIARALDYAHHQNIIHRDVKPANILISTSGAPLLSDFGIAKMLESGGGTQLTATGVGIGTPDYMAPEQWMGKADPSTDIYSLGVVFYEMITGHRPYTADTPAAVLLKHLRDPLPRPRIFISNLPEAVEQVVFKALAKEPANRFSDMGEFAKILEKLAREEVSQIEPMPLDEATLQGLNLTLLSPGAGQTVVASNKTNDTSSPVEQSPAKSKNLKFGLIALVGILVVLAGCVVIGGFILATRNIFGVSKTPTTVMSQATGIPNNTTTPSVKSTETFYTTTPFEIMPGKTPFTSIEGLPSDVPFLTDNNGDLKTQLTQGMTMYSFTTDLKSEDVVTFYKNGFTKNGWKIMSQTTGNNENMYVFMKAQTRTVMVNIIPMNGAATVTIIIPPIE